MSNAKNSSDPIDVHRVQSLLLSFGGSFFGARQFLAGQIVTDPADRKALAQMVVELSNHSRGNGIARYDKHKPMGHELTHTIQQGGIARYDKDKPMGSRGYNPGAGWKDK